MQYQWDFAAVWSHFDMLIVGLIFLAVVGLGELTHWLGHRRAARRRARTHVY